MMTTLVRALYSLMLYLVTPLVLWRLWQRGKKQPAYRSHLAERWGNYPHRSDPRPTLWVHAVSVGETRAAQPLIEALLTRYPTHRLLLTGMTPTGRETAQGLYGDRVEIHYLPYDFPDAVARFFGHHQPSLGVLMETELWPNLMAAAQARRIPMLLVNARLSPRSARGYSRFSALTRPTFAALSQVAAQTDDDAARLLSVGAPHVTVCGNIKFDVTPAPSLVRLGQSWHQALAPRPVWLAASTREGEEPLILDAWQQLKRPDALLILVPRHPQRFNEVADLLKTRGIPFQRRSIGLPTQNDAVWLGDSMGEMAAYYHAAALAFIGGSLLPLGGQNLIEAAACACPILIGPHTFNFQQATEDALNAGAAQRVDSPSTLAQAISELLAQPNRCQAMQAAAQQFAATHQGATEKTLALIAPYLPPV